MSAPWTHPLGVLAAVTAGALVTGWLSGRLVVRLARLTRRDLLLRLHDRCHRPWSATLVTVGLLAALPGAGIREPYAATIRHVLAVAAIAVVSWLLATVLFLAEDLALTRVRVDVVDNRRARKMRTQIAALRRLTAVVAAVVALAAILMTFPTLRAYGASVLASAGVAGIIAGLAAQTTLANVFAGLQLVFTDALRIDDVVVVEGEWGRVEELTLTYVVVHLWDERRLMLPATYFTTTPFQHWTRAESRVIGAVVLHVDAATPIPALRERAHQVIDAHPLWDRRDWVLQVTDMTEFTVVVRILASAADAPSAWDLRCDVREELITWLQREHPQSLTRIRMQADRERALLPV